jgi:hypothetical protein
MQQGNEMSDEGFAKAEWFPVIERVCFARKGSVGSIHPVAPLTFVSQAGSLVTRRVLVADATSKDFLE